jgi:hypothetical protein
MSQQAFIPCVPKRLPEHLWEAAARVAHEENPANRPTPAAIGMLRSLLPTDVDLTPKHIAAVTTKYWRAGSVDLSVQFLDNPPQSVRSRILQHMNRWGDTGNVRFRETSQQGQVRILRLPGDGYSSYLGVDILSIPAGQCTMNLDSFSDRTPESEYMRVVEHEAGHTLGFPHEHMRRAIVQLIDPQRAIAYFMATQGWTQRDVQQQVLTPLEEEQLVPGPIDQTSVMCYQLPGTIMKNGQPVMGGNGINAADAAFCAKLYPKVIVVTPPDPTKPTGKITVVLNLPPDIKGGSYTLQG